MIPEIFAVLAESLKEIRLTGGPHSAPTAAEAALVRRGLIVVIVNIPIVSVSLVVFNSFLIGQLSLSLALAELFIILIVMAIEIAIFRRLALPVVSIDTFDVFAEGASHVDDVISTRVRASLLWFVLSVLPVVGILFSSLCVISATRALRYLAMFSIADGRRTLLLAVRVIAVLVLVAYGTAAVAAPLAYSIHLHRQALIGRLL